MRSLRLGEGKSIKRIPEDYRNRHIYLVGQTRSGKTSLITNFVKQDSYDDVAVIWIEPSGVETEKILGIIDESRLEEDADYGKLRYCAMDSPLSLNFLKMPYRFSVIADTLMNVINQWVAYSSEQKPLSVGMKDVLRDFLYPELRKKNPSLKNVLLALKTSLKDFKLGAKTDAAKRLFGYSKEDIDSANRVVHRLSDILEDEEFSRIVCGEPFNWEDFLEKGEFLALNCRGMKRDQALFIGNIVIQSLTAYFTHTEKKEFPPCAIYVDEFEKFVNQNFIEIMRYSAKFNIGCLVSHQDHAMWAKSIGKEVLHTIWSNAGTFLAFRVGAHEASVLAKMFTTLKPHNFQNLEQYHLVYRIGTEEGIVQAPRPPIPDEVVFVARPKKFRIKAAWNEARGHSRI